MTGAKRASRYLLATFMMVAGTAHFLMPGFYTAIVPPELPFPLAVVYVSGALEVVLGVLLLVPQYTPLAAWGVFALLVAVFPANVYVYRHQELVPGPPGVHLLRLPLQGVFLLWAYWHTRPGRGGGADRDRTS
jgi:uncharacterized membrane protein